MDTDAAVSSLVRKGGDVSGHTEVQNQSVGARGNLGHMRRKVLSEEALPATFAASSVTRRHSRTNLHQRADARDAANTSAELVASHEVEKPPIPFSTRRGKLGAERVGTKARPQLAMTQISEGRGANETSNSSTASDKGISADQTVFLDELLRPIKVQLRMLKVSLDKISLSPEAHHSIGAFFVATLLLGTVFCGFNMCWTDVQELSTTGRRKRTLPHRTRVL
eukprot:CAMPEP_0170620312 /NCGR_PEP_ID=MMETSP0224-20130122/27991_1 /TAXON_ID=285029 /ORGANISM="Togula jolla, Strain CCCM 725" /LENGTH=222 /DNA_ID=CAMNT_0010946477 /DNA_START=154 /DNA_END=822 /DNA_ORIENTATION=+